MLTESDLKMVIRPKAHALRERTAKAPVIGRDGQPHVQGQGPGSPGNWRRGSERQVRRKSRGRSREKKDFFSKLD